MSPHAVNGGGRVGDRGDDRTSAVPPSLCCLLILANMTKCEDHHRHSSRERRNITVLSPPPRLPACLFSSPHYSSTHAAARAPSDRCLPFHVCSLCARQVKGPKVASPNPNVMEWKKRRNGRSHGECHPHSYIAKPYCNRNIDFDNLDPRPCIHIRQASSSEDRRCRAAHPLHKTHESFA